MSFQNLFEKGIKEANERLKHDSNVREAFRRYDGRTFVFNVTDDAVYVFRVLPDELKLEVNPLSYPNDMYLEMNPERARKLVYEKSVSKWDILTGKIKYRNISLDDVDFFKKILG